MLAQLSHTQGIAGACPVTILSISPQALARSAGSRDWQSALSIAALIFGSFSSGQFELLTGMIC